MLRLAVQSAALIVCAAAADVLLFDVSTKYSLLVAYSAERQQWADVLTYARRLPPSDVWNVFQVNRALYHRGELLERMFAYPQVPDAVPTLTLQFESLTATAQRVPLECGDILFELGRINESQHMAYEALELFGERPHTLQRLVYLHAIKGEPDAARRFLAVLERSLLAPRLGTRLSPATGRRSDAVERARGRFPPRTDGGPRLHREVGSGNDARTTSGP